MKPIIEVKNVFKRYQLGLIGATRLRDDVERVWHRITGQAEKAVEKEFWALRDVSFEVQPGEIVGIIGRNGAGKSTLLKILSRITEPTSGEIIMRGRVASLLEVGTGFHGDLTGRENIFLNGAILGMSKAEIKSKLDEIIAFAEIEKFIDTPVKRYSSGMYVRLAFAVAAHLEPEILIVDEVLAVGDVEFQRKCIGKMQDVSSEGRTILFVSHNLVAIEKLCQSCRVLNQGELIYCGPTIDALAIYQSLAKKNQNLPLAERLDRQGSGGIRCIKAYCLGTKGELTNYINSGERLRVIFEVDSQRTINNLVPGLNITDSLGGRVATFWNGFNPDVISLKEGHSQLMLDIKRLDLSPGKYTISTTLGNEGEALDVVENALDLNVLAPQSWHPARYPAKDHGPLFPEFSWIKNV